MCTIHINSKDDLCEFCANSDECKVMSECWMMGDGCILDEASRLFTDTTQHYPSVGWVHSTLMGAFNTTLGGGKRFQMFALQLF